MIALILVSNFEHKEAPLKVTAINEQLLTEDKEQLAIRELPSLEIIKSSKFRIMFTIGVCHLFYGYFFTNVYKDFGKNYINNDEFLTMVGATSSLFNGFFKFIWGTLLDYYPFRKVYGGLITLECALIVLISFSVYNKWTFMVVSWLTYMCDGSLMAMLPALTVM